MKNMIKIVPNNTNVEEFDYMYDQVGWGAYNREVSEEALKHNLFSVSVYEDDKIIGYGRLIGDKTAFVYIHDVMVAPKYQQHGIGTIVMNNLLEEIKTYRKINPTLRVYLGASKGKEGFYQRFGFVTREEADLGAGMIYKR